MLSVPDPALNESAISDPREVVQIIISNGVVLDGVPARGVDLVAMVALVSAASEPPALSNAAPLVTAKQEVWAATSTVDAFSSATAAHQFVRYNSGVAQPAADAAAPLNLAGV